jgi:hypothetical protein
VLIREPGFGGAEEDGRVPRMLLIALLAVSMLSGPAAAAEVFGIPVYPGASTDDAAVSFCAAAAMQLHLQLQVRGLRADIMCFRTSDAFSRVVGFYERQPLQRMPAAGNVPNRAMFCSSGPRCAGEEGGVQVLVQSPWQAGGAERTDVIVTISTSKKTR